MDTGVTEAEANGQLLGDWEGIPVMGGTLILSNSSSYDSSRWLLHGLPTHY